MIEFTKEQEELLKEVQRKFFEAAISKETDYERAEKAIETIVKPVISEYKIHWCTSLV
jgi:hypothetical protein